MTQSTKDAIGGIAVLLIVAAGISFTAWLMLNGQNQSSQFGGGASSPDLRYINEIRLHDMALAELRVQRQRAQDEIEYYSESGRNGMASISRSEANELEVQISILAGKIDWLKEKAGIAAASKKTVAQDRP